MNNALLPFIKKSLVLAISAALASTASSVASAIPPLNVTNITMDGTTGTTTSLVTLGAITKIDSATNGTTHSTNLFFSFGQFTVANTDTATFVCSSCGSISNVISRVTGGGASGIYGSLNTSGFTTSPNFWFFNPSGIFFGSNTTINVPAAFHISTANSLNFGSGSLPSTATTIGSTLVTGDPTSFGFLGSTGDITITGSNITIGNGSKIESANTVIINNAKIAPTSGTIEITAQRSISVDSSPAPSPALPSALTANLIATTTLTNAGKITGNATATTGNLLNDGTITGNVLASLGTLTNSATGTITGNATATASTLTNSGAITGNAEATAADLQNNSGATIGGSATAGTTLTNAGSITGDATANGNTTTAIRLDNSGTINGNAIATNSGLTNKATGKIKGNSTAQTDLTNVAGGQLGAAGKVATATTGNLLNDGTITGNALASLGTLTNSATGTITGNATATA
ncbi:MAG: filamentous hemagglutinin N-terminal domain-containing protein, partial [Methylococcales bacterium]